MHEECGVFGLKDVEDAANLSYYGLHSLQHRGQQSAGIVASDGEKLRVVKDLGLVNDVFQREDLKRLIGSQAIGQVRYSSKQENTIENVQPITVRSHQGDFALVLNGQIVNSKELRLQLEKAGSIFHGRSDCEMISHLIQRAKGNFISKIKAACLQLEGAFCLLLMTKNTMYAVKDKHGFHPLSLGRVGSGYAFSSETCAFEIVNAKFERHVEPGEIIKLGKEGFESHFYQEKSQVALCAMEYIYFARPDSDLEFNVHAARKETGRVIAQTDDCQADLVIGVPDSSLSAAMGYAEARRLPYEMGLIKNRYIGRTFIEPSQKERDRGVKMKISAVSSIIKGKRVVLLDDSIVRGTTSKRIVKLMKLAGAKEVHVRIVSPMLISPCFYGVDMTSKDQLIASRMSLLELQEFIEADSLKFLSIEQLKSVLGDQLCLACFNGDYPTKLYSYQESI